MAPAESIVSAGIVGCGDGVSSDEPSVVQPADHHWRGAAFRTTLLLSVLSAHAHIHGIAHETLAFSPPERGGPIRTPADFQLHRVYAPLAFSRPNSECTRWCEKTPGNIRNFDAILEHFGSDVRLIHIVRDGRDATTSRHPRRPTDYYYSPRQWAEIVSDGLRFNDHPQVAVVKYEDLVLDCSRTVETLCAFLGEPADDRILDWHRHTPVRTHTAWEGEVRAVHDTSVGRWRLPEHAPQVDRFMRDAPAVALLDELGYRVSA